MLNVHGMHVAARGGLLRIAGLDGDGFVFLEGDPEEFLARLRASHPRIDIFTFLQRLPDTSPRFAYPMEWDNFAALEITTFDQWWTQQIGFKARNKAKQAVKKGIVLQELPFSDELVEGIWRIYNENPVRQGKRFWHYGKDLQTVHRETATFLPQSIFIGAFFQGELIGFVKMVVDETNTQAGFMNIISMIKHRDKAPTNALFAEAVRSCADRGIPHLVYSRFAYGHKAKSPLSDFKERNGMRQINVPRYYVPLTRKGQIGIRLGFHKPLRDHLPEHVLATLRDLRAGWFRRRMGAASDN